MKKLARIFVSTLTVIILGCSSGGGGSDSGNSGDNDIVLRWNNVALDATALDHTPVNAGESRVYGEQLGPTKTSRGLAMMHIAIADAAIAVLGGFDSYASDITAPAGTSLEAAVSQAAHNVLSDLYPSQRGIFDQKLIEELASIADGEGKEQGINLGQQTAQAILEIRSNDHSKSGGAYASGQNPGDWRPDPNFPNQNALDPHWGKVTPFAMHNVHQYLPPPPPALNSVAYAEAFNEVKRLGGDGVNTVTERTEEQTFTGIFWGYDGTKSLCAPPRLYNQILRTVANQRGNSVLDNARLFALANIAMADAGIAGWYSKYVFNFWRPITAIREAEPGTGPSGRGDGNESTVGDPSWQPLGAPGTNQSSNFTPPFPAYVSGHATFGGALFETLRNFYGTDAETFTVVSDEFNGESKDANGETRPYRPRTFTSFSQAEEENGQSRIYLGIHFSFDKVYGIAQGRKVADTAFTSLYQPRG